MEDRNKAWKKNEQEHAAAESARIKRWYSSAWGSSLASHDAEWLVAILKQANARVVLEAGCGVGPFLINAVNHFDGVHGLDLSQENLAQIDIRSPTLSLVVGDVESLPYRSRTFDATVLSGVLHHVPDTERALRELHRVTRHRGLLILREPCGDTFLIRLVHRLFSKRREKYFRTRELRAQLESIGFTISLQRRADYVVFALHNRLWPFLARLRWPAWLWREAARTLNALDRVFAMVPLINRSSLVIIFVAEASHP